jgi:hypothetical protein
MANTPIAKFEVGDTIHAVANFPGQVAESAQYKILAVYKNALGFWYVGQIVTGPHVGDQDAISGIHYEKVK